MCMTQCGGNESFVSVISKTWIFLMRSASSDSYKGLFIYMHMCVAMHYSTLCWGFVQGG